MRLGFAFFAGISPTLTVGLAACGSTVVYGVSGASGTGGSTSATSSASGSSTSSTTSTSTTSSGAASSSSSSSSSGEADGCAPTTCAALHFQCGAADDGCGNLLDCGSCPAGEICGAEGMPGQCGGKVCECTPVTCAQEGFDCGTFSFTCGPAGCPVVTANCGTCAAPETCGGAGQPNVCGP